MHRSDVWYGNTRPRVWRFSCWDARITLSLSLSLRLARPSNLASLQRPLHGPSQSVSRRAVQRTRQGLLLLGEHRFRRNRRTVVVAGGCASTERWLFVVRKFFVVRTTPVTDRRPLIEYRQRFGSAYVRSVQMDWSVFEVNATSSYSKSEAHGRPSVRPSVCLLSK